MEKEKKPKFQVGDRVKLLKIDFDNEGQAGGRIGKWHDHHIGEIHTIKNVHNLHNGYVGYYFTTLIDGNDYIYDERGLKRVRKAEPIPNIPDVIGVIPPIPIPEVNKKKVPVKKEKKNNFPDLRKKLKIESLKVPHQGICSYGKQKENGQIILNVGDICHARISFPDDNKDKAYALALEIGRDFVELDGVRAIMLRRYSEYIINYSPWAPCFHKYGIDNAIKYGILMNIDKCSEELAGAAVALREGHEFKDKTERFCSYLDKGYSGNVAYLLSAFIYQKDKKYQLKVLHAAHSILHSRMDKKELFKFFKEGYSSTKDRASYRNSPRMYDGISEWVAQNKGKNVGEFLGKELNVKPPAGFFDKPVTIAEDSLYKLADKLEKLLNNH